MNHLDTYLNSLDEPERRELQKIRELIHSSVPEATEEMTYGMPGFKYKGKYLIAFAAAKNHLGLYPTPGPIEELKEELTPYTLSKGTIQFTFDNPLPENLIRKILHQRITTIEENSRENY